MSEPSDHDRIVALETRQNVVEGTVRGILARLDAIDERLRKTELHLAVIIVGVKCLFAVLEHYWRSS